MLLVSIKLIGVNSILTKGIVASAMLLTSLFTVVMNKGSDVSAIVTTIVADTTTVVMNKGIVVSTIVIQPMLVLRLVQRL